MGTTWSEGGGLFTTPDISREIEESLNQVLYAFNHEFPLQSRHQHHQNSPNVKVEDSLKHFQKRHHHRSQSLDRYNSEDHQRTVTTKSSVIRRQWQCQLCHTTNESDTQLCVDCGSNKINVYIPVMTHIDKNKNKKQHQETSSAVLR